MWLPGTAHVKIFRDIRFVEAGVQSSSLSGGRLGGESDPRGARRDDGMPSSVHLRVKKGTSGSSGVPLPAEKQRELTTELGSDRIATCRVPHP